MTDRKRILVIDDDEAHLVATRGILEEEGYEVHVYGQPFGATNVIRELQPSLVLLDVNMPGLSGEKLTEVFQTHPLTRKIPVVLYSSNDEASLREAVFRLGLHGYISKGSPVALRRRVASMLALLG